MQRGAIELDLLTEENLPEARAIDRSDIPETFVDTVDTLMAYTRYGWAHGCLGYTFLIRAGGKCVGVLLLGEAVLWETDPPEMQEEPFYRLMGFVIDRRCRGRGIGSAALEQAVTKVWQDFGVRPLALGVHVENHGAEAFYRRHGFHPVDAMEGSDRYWLRYPEES